MCVLCMVLSDVFTAGAGHARDSFKALNENVNIKISKFVGAPSGALIG